MKKEQLTREAVQTITQEAQVSGNKWQDLIGVFRLPKDLGGVRILDLCAGQSNFCAWLLEQGARACAIDPLYSDLEQLHLKRMRNLLEIVGLADKISVRDPRLRERIDPDTRKFLDSIKRDPSSYLTASAHMLPFCDNLFQIVTSYYGIFGVMDRNQKLLELSAAETFRVLKRGGELQIAPALIGPNLTEKQRENQVRLLEKIGKDKNIKISYEERPCQDVLVGRVIITKP